MEVQVRKILLIAAIAALSPLSMALAQSQSAAMGSSAGMPADSANCGTPDEPKACPPLPRVPLKNYRGDR